MGLNILKPDDDDSANDVNDNQIFFYLFFRKKGQDSI